VTPGQQPTEAVRAIHEAQLPTGLDEEPGPAAARWPGHEIEDGTDDDVLQRLRDGLDEL
jgi:hypothetical protein